MPARGRDPEASGGAKPGGAGSPSRKPVVAPRPSPDWERRKAAAAKYQPKTVKLLLVVDAPPAEGSFYFEDAAPDPLFEDLAQVFFEAPAMAGDRTPYLKELRRRGIFLIELKPDAPLEKGESLAPYADWLPTRAEVLEPAHVILLGAAVHDAAFEKLKKAGVPVEETRVAFREGGDRKEARGQLRTAMVRAGLEKLIRELPPKARETLPSAAADVRGDGEPPAGRGRILAIPSRAPESDAPREESTKQRAPKKTPQRSRPPGKRTPDSSR
jgi:hypothetical protein